MSTGEGLGLVLGLFLISWVSVDIYMWESGRQTFTQWVIKESKKRLSFTIVALVLIIGGASWLVWHFELIPILVGKFNLFIKEYLYVSK